MSSWTSSKTFFSVWTENGAGTSPWEVLWKLLRRWLLHTSVCKSENVTCESLCLVVDSSVGIFAVFCVIKSTNMQMHLAPVAMFIYFPPLLLSVVCADPESEKLSVLWYPLLDRHRVLSGWTGCSCYLHHTTGWIFGLHSDPAPRGSGSRVWCLQGIFQKGDNVSEKGTIHHHLSKVEQTVNILIFICSYMKGGVASGMRHTETNTYDIKRLLQVKGNKRVIAKEVSHTLQSDCMILWNIESPVERAPFDSMCYRWKWAGTASILEMCFCWTLARPSSSGTGRTVTDRKGLK